MGFYHFLAAVAAGTTSAATTFEHAPVHPEDAEIIEMRAEQYERLTVPVTIMGQGPFRFVIDTGAQATVLSKVLADQLGLHERKPAVLIGMASREEIEVAEVPQFSLGSRTMNLRNAPLVDRENIGGADGIVGLDSLQGQRVMLDFRKNEMLVADSRDLGGNRGYEIIVNARPRLGQLIVTDARLNGVKVQVIIDTGAQGSIGNHALLKKLKSARPVGEAVMTDINGARLIGTKRQGRSLTLGQLSLNNLAIVFTNSPFFHALNMHDEPALVLGVREMRLFSRVAIDFEERKILFDLPANDNSTYDPIGRFN